MAKKALIFGSTGKIGGDLVEILCKDRRFDEIITISRKVTDYDIRIKQVEFDFEHWDKLAPFFTPETDVFVAIGTTQKKTPNKDNYRAIDIGIPVSVAKQAEKGGCASLSVVSSVGADVDAKGFYLQTKGTMEEKVAKAFTYGNLHIFRPSLLLGERDESRFFERVFIKLYPIFDPLLRKKFNKYRGIDSKDVARAMIFAAVNNVPAATSEFDTILAWSKSY
jgi:nucleoside-diphosphate-sugar epimerase